MYLSFNNIRIIFKYFLVSLLFIIIQAYSPQIWINSNLKINIDFLLILITYLAFTKEVYIIIFYAFFIGLFQDFIINVDMIGVSSLVKIFFVYFISILKKFNHLWVKNIKLFYLFTLYFFHFLRYPGVFFIYSYDFLTMMPHKALRSIYSSFLYIVFLLICTTSIQSLLFIKYNEN